MTAPIPLHHHSRSARLYRLSTETHTAAVARLVAGDREAWLRGVREASAILRRANVARRHEEAVAEEHRRTARALEDVLRLAQQTGGPNG